MVGQVGVQGGTQSRVATGGIHMQRVLVKVGDETWRALGRLNGSEIGHKLNREVVLL